MGAWRVFGQRLCFRYLRRKIKVFIAGEVENSMGQGDIIDLLKKRDKWISTYEIARSLKTARSSALVKLRKLRARKEILCKKKNHGYVYKMNEN